METIYEIQRIKQEKEEMEVSMNTSIKHPQDAYKIAKAFIGDEDREIFFVMCLNTKNKVTSTDRWYELECIIVSA